MKRTLVTLALLLAVAQVASAQRIEPEKPALLVYGDGFAFAVTEPPSWSGDTEHAAEYHVNVVFFPSDAASRKADVTIRVRLNPKVDEDTAGDLEYDAESYKKEYAGVRFDELALAHPSYPIYSRLFSVPKSFYEYVAYLNPGKGLPFTFSVSMSIAKRPATPGELAALRAVVTSLRLLKPTAG